MTEKYKVEETFRMTKTGLEYIAVTKGPEGVELTVTTDVVVRLGEPLVFGSVEVEPGIVQIGVNDFLQRLERAREIRLHYLVEPTLDRLYAETLLRKHEKPPFVSREEGGKARRERQQPTVQSVEDLTMQIMDATRKNPDEFKADLRSIRELYDWAVETDKSFNAKL